TLLSFDNKINIGFIATSLIVLITSFQLVRSQKLQKANYIKELLTEFRRDTELYNAYYDLIYSYRNNVFLKIEEIALDIIKNEYNNSIDKDKLPIFTCFDHLQENRERGSYFYYPQLFHFSIEERRLDGVLDYFNTVAFYWYQGLIRMDDIVDLLGNYIDVLINRKIISNYLEYALEKWDYKNSSPPYLYLSLFFIDFKKYGASQKNQNYRGSLKSKAEKYFKNNK
ncbi:MAG: hypothetical protein AAGF83_21095, partial [Cyanobacteria bacterium P01_G01_bin.67]